MSGVVIVKHRSPDPLRRALVTSELYSLKVIRFTLCTYNMHFGLHCGMLLSYSYTLSVPVRAGVGVTQ